MGPDALAQVLCHLPKFSDPNLLVGFDTSDDAAVYKVNEELALIQTVDIFPPVVDDPYEYGKIAAANSLSDVYAMGGRPKLAMNVFCFPEDLAKEHLQAILQGGYEKVAEADAMVVGGHTIKDPVPKYGLSVTGFVHPDKVLKNNAAPAGDVLILTKALGSGILTTADRGGILTPAEHKAAVDSMEFLNKYAALVMEKEPIIHACTDVTGFGLLGHCYEMAAGSGQSFFIDSKKIPALPGALDYASMGIVPANAYKNRGYLDGLVSISDSVPENVSDLLFDPQTSGGLLIAVPEAAGEGFLRRLKDLVPVAEIIGHTEPYREYPIYVD